MPRESLTKRLSVLLVTAALTAGLCGCAGQETRPDPIPVAEVDATPYPTTPDATEPPSVEPVSLPSASPPDVTSAIPAVVQRSAVPDGINSKFLDPKMIPEEWLKRFEVESREIFVARQGIIDAIGLNAGEAIADIGAGTGLFVEPFSNAVGDTGRVYAVEIAPRFVEYLTARARDEGLSNVRAVLSTHTTTELKPSSVDVVFACDTYHHFEYHEAINASIYGSLRPGGRYVIVDFERIPGVSREWVLGHVRCGREQVIREITGAGFEFLGQTPIAGLEENYYITFRKPL